MEDEMGGEFDTCVETEGRRALDRSKCKWEDNIKIIPK
jgi:hypothetical protein